jgi:hypothetical protein
LPALKNSSFKRNWDTRLNKQVAELPDINIVIKNVEKKLKALFIALAPN